MDLTSEVGEFNIDVDELTEQSPKSDQPSNINVTLKDHQLTLLYRCIQYETQILDIKEFPKASEKFPDSHIQANMAIIGDRVGSGKSYVILSLISINNITNKNNVVIKSYGLNNVIYFIPDAKKTVKTNLLIIPHNLTNQWDDYIKRFSSNLKYMIINRHKHVDSLYEESFNIENLDLIVVTGTLYNKVANYITEKGIKLQRLIVDEVDNVNIPGCVRVEACFTWFVTASYGNVLYPRGFSKYEQNIRRHICFATGIRNNGYIKDVLTDLNGNISRELVKVLIVKNSEAYVEKSISLPPIYNYVIKCKTPNTINILNGIVDKNIIDFLNANDVFGALQCINPSNRGSEDNIVRLLIDKYTKQLTNIKLNFSMVNQMVFENENERRQEIDNLNSKIQIIENKIMMISNRIRESNVCIICYEPTDTNRTITTCCQNSFCFPCINTWLLNKAACPMCKAKMTSNDYMVINEDMPSCSHSEIKEIDEHQTHESFDKYKNLKIVLENRAVGSKFLIFSAYDSSFNDVLPILANLEIKFEYLKGPGSHIASIVRKYKEKDLDVLLVNMRNYGSGLNLENTSDIVMFHKESNQSECQIIGRAHRMGKTDPLNIHYLLYANEMK